MWSVLKSKYVNRILIAESFVLNTKNNWRAQPKTLSKYGSWKLVGQHNSILVFESLEYKKMSNETKLKASMMI